MGVCEAIGCLLIAFGPALSIFLIVVAPDPLRIILFVLGAFFWLLSLLISSLFWIAVVPLRDTPEFGLFFSIAFQELFRFLYFYLLRFAEKGLDKLGENGGMQIAGVHSLKKSRHTISMVCGLGMGVVAGLFMLVNVAADFSGDATAGLPAAVNVAGYTTQTTGHGDYTFFLMSSIGTSALVLLHSVWTVILWEGLNRLHNAETTIDGGFSGTKKIAILQLGLVIVTHYVASLVTLLNRQRLYAVTLSTQYVVLASLAVLSYYTVGGSFPRRSRMRHAAGTEDDDQTATNEAVDATPRESPAVVQRAPVVA